MHCRLLKYLINTIKTSWQNTAVTVHPQLAGYPEKGPSGCWGAWAQLAVTVWPQGIIRLPWQSTSSPSGKTKGHSRITHWIRLGSNTRNHGNCQSRIMRNKKGHSRPRRGNSQGQQDQRCCWKRQEPGAGQWYRHVLKHSLGRAGLWREGPRLRVSKETDKGRKTRVKKGDSDQKPRPGARQALTLPPPFPF